MSITNLFKQNAMSPFPAVVKDTSNPSLMDNNKLFNPAIPGDTSELKKDKQPSIYDKLKINRKFIINQNESFDKFKNQSINGDFLRLKQTNNYGNHSYNQQLEASIDPVARMQRLNPLKAPPYNYITGAEDMNFRDLPKTDYTSSNYVDLVNKARNSYSSRLVSLGQIPTLQINGLYLNGVYIPPKV